jgi:signal transduction histidine kinase
MHHQAGDVALAWRPGAELDFDASPSPDSRSNDRTGEREVPAVELVRRAREAWLDIQELDRLPDSVWGVLKLMPALWTALERAETSAESSQSVGRILAREVTSHIDPVESALRKLAAAPTPDWPEESKTALAELQSLVDRLICVADDLGHLHAPTSLREVVDEVFAVHRLRAEQLGVVLTGSYDLPPLPVDVERLRLALSLLVEDAVRRCRPAGSGRFVAVRAWRSEPGGWRIEVADNGELSRPLASRSPAALVDEAHGAAELGDLGLDICRLAVEQMGGELWTLSDDDGGTRVCFTVPERERRQPG